MLNFVCWKSSQTWANSFPPSSLNACESLTQFLQKNPEILTSFDCITKNCKLVAYMKEKFDILKSQNHEDASLVTLPNI